MIGSRVKLFIDEFKRNPVLRFCFHLCRDLKIDDPFAWVNSVDPVVIDRWAAFYVVDQHDLKEDEDPAEALGKMFSKFFRGENNHGKDQDRGAELVDGPGQRADEAGASESSPDDGRPPEA